MIQLFSAQTASEVSSQELSTEVLITDAPVFLHPLEVIWKFETVIPSAMPMTVAHISVML